MNSKLEQLHEISALLGGQQDPVKALNQLLEQQEELKKKIQHFEEEQTSGLKDSLLQKSFSHAGDELHCGEGTYG